MKNFITYLFLLFFLSGCGYTQLEMLALDFEIANERERLSLEKYSNEFIPSVGRFNKDIIIHYPNYSTQFVQSYSYWPYYPRYERRRNHHHRRDSYSRSHIYPFRVRSHFRQREKVVREIIRAPKKVTKEVTKEPVVKKPADDKVEKEIWRRRNNPRGAKKLPPLIKKEK